MFRVERQYKHHVPQGCIDFPHIRLLAVVTVNRDSFLVTILVVNVNGCESLSESLYFKVQLQQSSHLFNSHTYVL